MLKKIIAWFKREDDVARGIARGAVDRVLKTEKAVADKFVALEKQVKDEIAALKAELAKAERAIANLKKKRTQVPVKGKGGK